MKERAHSKFSASGSERWHACPGSVALSEGLPDKSSSWAEEGTLAHEVLERVLQDAIKREVLKIHPGYEVWSAPGVTLEMIGHARDAANFILNLYKKYPFSEILVETRIYLDFIHPEMFGTFDGAVIDHFGTLHVFDYKYGAGHSVSPKENLQMIFYAMGLADKHQWNFKKVRMWIIQPRIKGYDGPSYWDLSITGLLHYVDVFRDAVERVLRLPNKYVEGSWCHWCKAKKICPLKLEARKNKTIDVFTKNPF